MLGIPSLFVATPVIGQKTAMCNTDKAGSQRSKADWRRYLRDKRNQLSVTAQEAGHAIARHIVHLPQWHAAQRVALYYPADGEIDTDATASLCRAQGKLIYLPVIQPQKRLAFARWEEHDVLQTNRFGIPEPPVEADQCHITGLDVVLVPLVGWDRSGTRLGMGGGFYDRALSDTPVNKPLLVGLGYSQQEVASLPRDSWDVLLNFVLTEQGLCPVGPLRPDNQDSAFLL